MTANSRWVCLLLAAALFSYAGQTQQQPRRTVTGSVNNSITGEPIRHALVQLPGAPGVLTGVDGRFEIDNVPEGLATFSVSKPGFFEPRMIPGTDRQQAGMMLTVGPGTNEAHLTLFPAAKIVGRITDADGEGVEQTQVEVLAEQIESGRKQWQPRSNAESDDDGSYRVGELMPGRYVIFVSGHSWPGPSLDMPQDVSAPAFYPGVPDLSAAQIIELRAGEEFRADFKMRSERGFRVAGRLSGGPANPNLGLVLQNSTGQDVSSQTTRIDPARGEFMVLGVPQGTWTAVATANDNQGHSYEGRQEITVNQADVSNVLILLHRNASIPVVVNHIASQPEQVSADQPSWNPGLNPSLVSADPSKFVQIGLTKRIDPPSMVFENVSEGRYRLNVQSYAGDCVQSAFYGNVDVLRDDLIVGPDGASQTLTINVGSDCATLGAQVDPEERYDAGYLLVVPSSLGGEPEVLPIAKRSARPAVGIVHGLSLTLPPGSYQVFAFSDIAGLEYANPEALRDYTSQTVDLTSAQKADLTVKLIERKGN